MRFKSYILQVAVTTAAGTLYEDVGRYKTREAANEKGFGFMQQFKEAACYDAPKGQFTVQDKIGTRIYFMREVIAVALSIKTSYRPIFDETILNG